MNFAWQNVAVLAIVATACAYLARVAWQTVARRKAAACGGCGTCPANSAKVPEVVALSQTTHGVPPNRSGSGDSV